jgi:hypothetical protein
MNGLVLHYSGGTGANRADHDIAGYLAYLRKQNDSLPTTVISNDLAVQQNAQSHQASLSAVRPLLGTFLIHTTNIKTCMHLFPARFIGLLLFLLGPGFALAQYKPS